MYINNDVCLYNIRKDDNKCGRIFRPWDNEIAKNFLKDTAQDSTVSTTTRDEELTCKIEEKTEEKVFQVQEKACDTKRDNCKKQSGFTSTISIDQNSSPKHSISSPCLQRDCKISKINNLESSPLNKCTKSNQLLRDSLLQSSSLCPKQYDGLSVVNPELFLQSTPLPIDYLSDPYNPINADLVQANLAQHLGLPPNDPLLLESLAQGYALEEYARVLTQEQQTKLMAAKKQRPKKYKCPHCDVGFSNNGQLKGHIRIHTGERPFKCDEKDCGKTFTRNEELTRHKRIHSGLRPFPCSHCGKRFGRKDHLKKHSRTHFQPRGLYAVPVVLPFEAWASGQTNGYPFFPVMY